MTEHRTSTPRAAPRLAIIVSHTHWDREWYLTYHQFRTKLVSVVRQVLDQLEQEPEFRHFLLDGQSIILEDYLAIRPRDEPRVRRLVEQGALSLGPWYVLPDEFLVSAESTVRNMLLGHAVASRYGGVQKVGYLPDSFGHIAQLPQILRKSGIDSFVYTRGNGDELEDLGHEYVWEAPDGSRVLAVNQWGGYSNAGSLGHREEWEAHTQRAVDVDLAVERVGELFDTMPRSWSGEICLLNNGCDHFPPQRDFADIVRALRKVFPDTEFRHGSLAEYIAEVRDRGMAAGSHAGELLGGRYHFILPGVWSTRVYLKQWNTYAQDMLAGLVEPFSAYMHFCRGRDYPGGLIEYTWKLLLQNHPHDSICGCSTDEVHRQMVSRFAGVVETAEQIVREHLVHLTPTFARRPEDDGSTALCVMNTLPERRTAVVDRLVVLQPSDTDIESLCLYDERGAVVPFELIDKWFVDRFWSVDYRTELFGDGQVNALDTYLARFPKRFDRSIDPSGARDRFLRIRFLAADLPPVGHVQFFLRDADRAGGNSISSGADGKAHGVTVDGNRLQNEHLVVDVHSDGTFDVRETTTGRVFLGLNRLEDMEDVGDEYDYSPCAETESVTSEGSEGVVRTLDSGGLQGRLEVEYDMHLPVSIEPERTRRSNIKVPCRATTRVGLKRGSRIVEVELLFDNRVEDHRLRAKFPTGIATDCVVSDGHFYVNHRPVQQPAGTGWRQPPSGTYPQQEFTLVQDSGGGIAVFNKGLPEVQAVRSVTGELNLHLTLLRAVGWLSRDDFDTRSRANAGPTLHTPDAQCLGMNRFEYAVMPFVGDYVEAGVKSESQRYHVPVVAIQGVEDGHVGGGAFLLESAGRSTAVTAIKRHEERDSLVVRLFNLTSAEVEERLKFGLDVLSAWRLNLLEERLQQLMSVRGRELALQLGPHEIATLEIEFSSGS